MPLTYLMMSELSRLSSMPAIRVCERLPVSNLVVRSVRLYKLLLGSGAARLVPVDLDVGQRRPGRGRLREVVVEVGRAQQVGEVVVTVAYGIDQRHVVVELVLQADGADVDVVLCPVIVDEPVVVAAIDGCAGDPSMNGIP